MEANGRGSLEISLRDAPGVTIGSLQGNGTVFLGANNLTVGSNNADATFGGVIQDGGIDGGSGGSLTKIGSGALVLSGLNSYSGGTTIDAGTPLALTKGASATGTGTVLVNAGTLGGTSKLTGPIVLGIGGGSDAFVSPGVNGPGRLTTQGAFTFNDDAVYLCEVSTTKTKADQISSRGVSIGGGALFSFVPLGHRSIQSGTVFTVIKNSSRNPIAGTFSNLPDGATFSDGVNTYIANYEGGTGNDLTLTVLP